MKKFHFYLSRTEVGDITHGDALGDIIRDDCLVWNKKSAIKPAVKVTLRLSMKPLINICEAEVNGEIDIGDDKYSPKAIIAAIHHQDCSGGVFPWMESCQGTWFARAKVEQI